jgi:hypothetical protein
MPKKSNAVPKSQRIDALRKILSRWGRLNKTQIDSHLAAQLDVDGDAISRTVYRDLEELTNNNEVRAYYFTRDGQQIVEFDPEVHKNTICEWSLVGSESQIIGQDILKENGALLLASDRLSKYLKIDSGSTNVEFKTLHIFFNIPNHFLCLKISREMLPMTLVIGRISAGESNPQKIFKHLEERFGKRSLLLSLPYASVSSFKPDKDQLGHTVLNFNASKDSNGIDEIVITDLNSKNKTLYCKLSQVEADLVRKKGIETHDKTLTEGWNHIAKSDLNLKRIVVSGRQVIQSPSLVFVSELVPVLVI